MDALPSDILVYELSKYLYPRELLKLCGVSKTFNSVFNLRAFKLQSWHLTYFAEFYSDHFASVLHDEVLDLSNNALLNLSEFQLRHLEYLVINHHTLFDEWSKVESSSPQSKSLISALRCIGTLNLQSSAHTFAVQPYATTFLCQILRHGFSTSASADGLCLKLSSNNLSSTQLSLICRALISRKKPLRVSQLELSQNQINDRAMSCLLSCVGRRCPQLESIDFSYAQVFDASVDAIAAFYDRYAERSKLNSIDLSFTRVTSSGLYSLDSSFDRLKKPKTSQKDARRKSFSVKIGRRSRDYACSAQALKQSAC